MDKRTILFVLSLTFTLFLVNMYFESQNSDKLKTWTQQQAAKKQEKAAKLSEEIASRTMSPTKLPIVEVSTDAKATTPWKFAVKAGKTLVVLASPNETPPNTIYAKANGATPTAYNLAGGTTESPFVLIYRTNDADLASIGELPDFGRYELQLIHGEGNGANALQVTLGDYVDGHLDIPSVSLAKLKEQAEGHAPAEMPQLGASIALVKTAQGYVPVGVYSPDLGIIEPLSAMPELSSLLESTQKKEVVRSDAKMQEKFYVLETPYQQIVFSNYGGAVVEINLPFQGPKDEMSAVKEVEFDREMVEKHPYNAHFPSHAYFTPSAKVDGDFVEHAEGVLGGYYPLLRRDLIEKDKRKTVRVAPRYYGLNIVSDYPETAELVYTVKHFDQETIVFEVVQPHRTITKTFSVASESQAPYCVDLTVKIEGDSRNLWITSGVPEVELISGAAAPSLKFRQTRNLKSEVEPIDLPKDSTTVTSVNPDWLSNSNGFFGIIMDGVGEIEMGYRAQFVPGTIVPSRLVEIGQEFDRFKAQDLPGYLTLLPLSSKGGTMHYRIFAGPFAESVLKTVDKVYTNSATGYNPDYIACQTFHGWFAFISEPFAKFLFILMNFFHSITSSWALSIVLLTVALRIMLWPLNAWSTKSMLKMQQIAPQVTAIQERYKKDPKKAQLEVMNLYRESGVNPVSGCFPLLIQMPFLIGMFDLLKSTFELRGASFIPGWIDNLAAPDVLFSWKYPIFFIGNEFHLLPFLLGGVMYLQQSLMSTLPKDKSLWTEQQRQQKFMGHIMAVMFTVMFYNFPSGLNIYWLSSMLLGILQQWWTSKRLKNTVIAKGGT